MKDLGSALRTAYYNELNGNITYNGSNVTIYDSKVPNNVNYPYIILGNFNNREGLGVISTKTGFGNDCTFELEVITGTSGNAGGRLQSDSISNQIIKLIRTRTNMDLSPSFSMMSTTLDNTTSVTEEAGDFTVFRRIIRFRHLISEN